MTGAFTWSDAAYAALAFFLVIVGLGLVWALLALAGTLTRVTLFLRGAQDEVLPVINKVGGTVDRVNTQLDKLDPATDGAVDTVVAIDETVRVVSFSVRRPIELFVGLTAGLSHGFATLVRRRRLKAAIQSAREASARRRADLAEELRRSQVRVVVPAVEPPAEDAATRPRPPTT